MEQIILIIVGFLAVAYLFDMWRQSALKKKASASEDGPNTGAQQNTPLSANEAMPTQTGRFRAKQFLDKAKDSETEKKSTESKEEAGEEEDDALPDPFDR